MRSMTGYGKGVAEKNERKVTVELKSVNHRFLDILFKLPRGFQSEEEEIRRVVSESVKRGHIEVFLSYEDLRKEKDEIKIDTCLAALYADAAKEIAKMGVANDLTASVLLRLPDVLTVTPIDTDENLKSAIVAEAAREAVKNLLAMREREGGALNADMSLKIGELYRLQEEVAKRVPEVQRDYREKLTARVKEALQDTAIDEARLLNEIAFFTDKANVDEETVRLKGHLDHFSEIIDGDGPHGKRLDFLVQEMNREVNTTGSKSQDLALTENVLKMKNVVEMLREQIQNLE